MSITIRGINYPSVKDAAEKLGLHVNAIYNAKRAGNLDRVGLGRHITTVKIRGVVYTSAKEASEKLGVHINGIYNALSRGNLDNVGLGPGAHNSPRNGNSKRLDFGRISFASRAEASRYIGKSDKYVTEMFKRGKRELVIGKILAKWQKDQEK